MRSRLGDRRIRLGSLVGVAGLMLATSTVTGGCTSQARCLPEPLVVSPATAPAGSSVVVSSPPAACDLDYPPGTAYVVTLRANADGVARETAAPVGTDGEFSAVVEIPADFPAGPATISVTGSTFDECADDPPAGVACASYQTTLTVTD